MRGGVVFGYEKLSKTKEKMYCVENNTHTIVVGSTRSGKTRRVILQTIGLLGMSGESIIVSDPKGELYDFTSTYLENLGYKVLTLDLKNTRKSDRYNFLQPVIDALNRDDIQDAIDKTWDITETLMPENDKGEPIWKNGEASIIASSILMVAFENRKEYKYQNIANVYNFIVEMSKNRVDEENKSIVYFEKISELLKKKNSDNPALDLLAISEIAHPRTRSSFYISALTTLKLFTNMNINSITSDTNIDLKSIGKEKIALFIIIPDEKETYYSIASMFINQLYASLVEQADRRGGILKQRVNFILEEFGNFTKIPGITSKLTVAGGRNIRFCLCLQSFKQLDDKYNKEVSSIIRYNCENWIYVQTDDPETLKELSERLGKYTTSSYSLSNNSNGGTLSMTTNSGSSIQLIGRELLTPDEIKKITNPYILFLSRKLPAVMYLPDLSEWNFNSLFSMGDEEHNVRLRFVKNLQRENKIKDIKKVQYWTEILSMIEIHITEEKIEKIQKNIESLNKLAISGDAKALNTINVLQNNIKYFKNKLRELKYDLSKKEKDNETK